MPLLKPGKYFIACELSPRHRVLDLPSQDAHRESGLVQVITGNGSEYQKWLVETVPGEPEAFTIRSGLLGGKFVEPIRTGSAGNPTRSDDGLLLAFYPRAGSPYQCWILEPSGTSDTFYIRNVATGKCWDLREQDPSHIQQLYKKDTPHQRWIFTLAG